MNYIDKEGIPLKIVYEGTNEETNQRLTFTTKSTKMDKESRKRQMQTQIEEKKLSNDINKEKYLKGQILNDKQG